jgi:hypothetical protein
MNAEENSMSFSKRADYYRMMKNYHMACKMVQKWLSSVSMDKLELPSNPLDRLL